MKIRNDLIKYFWNRINTIHLLLDQTGHSYSTVYYHKLRVEIKKLNAFFELLEFCSPEFDRKYFFKPYKNIFREAGRIREFQLEEATLKKYISHGALENYTMQIINTRRIKEIEYYLIKTGLDLRKLEKRANKIIPFIREAHDGKIFSYVKSKKEGIGQLLKMKNPGSGKIHQLRKQLKKYYYNLKSLRVKNYKEHLERAEVLQELLGKWHDCIVITGHLYQSLSSGKMIASEKAHTKKIILKINIECNLLSVKINKERKLFAGKFISG